MEGIRQSVTGNASPLLLDLAFSVVLIAVMLAYSGWLTLVVVVSLPLYLGLSLAITPLLRACLQEKFNRGAEKQVFLVEMINGIATLKATAANRRWRAAGRSSRRPTSAPASVPRRWGRWRTNRGLPPGGIGCSREWRDEAAGGGCV